MYAFITTKAVAVGLAATAILGGGVAAEASGTTAMFTGRTNAEVAAQSDRQHAIETLANIEADTHATAGLDRARAAVALDRPSGQADVDASADASIGAQVSAEARSRVGAMKDFVLELLGVETGHGANASVSASTGAGVDTAINAVTDAKAKANAAADGGLSTALSVIGNSRADGTTTAEANTNAEAGLATALEAMMSAGSEASEGTSSEANVNAQATLEGLGASAGGSAEGSAGLRLKLSRSR
ncbi:MAG: hypothetical protein C4558_07740 [Dehalococcoidia bacterium]|nr:MAG: hypothetical protein C4558_07740 [Dehalococcoidia bacterium]